MTDASSGHVIRDGQRLPVGAVDERGGGPSRGTEFLRLVEVMDALRSPGGCPWDAEQTHSSLLEYLIEEAYETVDAVQSGDRADLREELGDLLLQVVFHSRIAQEDRDDPFDIDAVAAGIADKLIARHPHVFGGTDELGHQVTVEDAADVEAIWQRRKAAEKGRKSVVDGVPSALPAAALAGKLVTRARRGGISEDVLVDPWFSAAVALPDDEQAFGELLLAQVAAGRQRGWDAEAALRGAAQRMRTRIIDAESGARSADSTGRVEPGPADAPTDAPEGELAPGVEDDR